MAGPFCISRNKTDILTGQLLFLLLPYDWTITSTDVHILQDREKIVKIQVNVWNFKIWIVF